MHGNINKKSKNLKPTYAAWRHCGSYNNHTKFGISSIVSLGENALYGSITIDDRYVGSTVILADTFDAKKNVGYDLHKTRVLKFSLA